jgi:cardiolipin synthase
MWAPSCLQVAAGRRSQAGAPPKATPTVATANGTLRRSKASALLARRWANATPDLKALAVLEEQATGVPLIAGNKVTLLFDGPATMREMIAAARAPPPRSTWKPISSTRTRSACEFADAADGKAAPGRAVNIMSTASAISARRGLLRAHARGRHPRGAFNPVNPAKAKGNWESTTATTAS